MAPAPRLPWRVLALACLAALAFAFSFQIIPPLVGVLVGDLGMTHGQAGLLMGLFTLPGILLALPGGVLADRWGHGRMALISLALMAGGTLLMLPLSPWALFCGRALAGAGAAVLVTVIPPIIHRAFAGPRAGLAMGIYNTAMPIGTLVSFNLAGALALTVGLPTLFAAVAGLCGAAFLSFLLGYQEHPGDWRLREQAQARPLRGGFSLRGLGTGLWILSLAWGCYNVAVLGFLTFAGDYLRGAGYAPGDANLIASLPMGCSIPVLLAAGWLMRAPGRKGALILFGCLVAAAGIGLFWADPSRAWWWAPVLAAGMGAIPPAVFTLVPLLVPAQRAATGFGVLNGVFNLSVFLGIPAAGAIRDATGGYAAALFFLSALGLAGAGFALLLIWRGRSREC